MASRVVKSAMASTTAFSRRSLHTTCRRAAVTKFLMPAMSPTMTEGGIAQWKKKEGEAFSTGDILLEIETDKATMDVEAQDDGIMGKIIAPDGSKSVPVGKIIALLAEEGDDISNLEVPKEEPKEEPAATKSSPTSSESSSSPPPKSEPAAQPPVASHGPLKHSKPLFPSVLRLLVENGISDADKLKGTGRRGMLTKGDVLAHLGKASSPTGTYKESAKESHTPVPPKEEKVLDANAVRKLILAGLVKSTAPRVPKPAEDLSFASIIADYVQPKPSRPSKVVIPGTPTKSPSYFDGLI
ncbi:hypothetical protein BOTBODRAFT_34584 [Botryobasidium botryosum FD-172 SS1]|uniref:Lipoyl-binding domain-containing protein n=1 Tax=Botryobasidium botryosum (strain FD-172 SS1) TaxID=930990 RepID=A0A067M960_BOTB1|nr:hypothetical protein BOTBODRAFT_34584 [Botryobasidium botryosum FD-172 SS1]